MPPTINKNPMALRKKFPTYRQLDQMDCGPTCAKIVTDHFGVHAPWDELRAKTDLQKGGSSFMGLSRALESYGIGSLAMITDLRELVGELPLPLIAHWQGEHFVVVHRVTRRKIHVSDPALGLVRYNHKEFRKEWAPEGKGVVLLLEQQVNYQGNGEEDGAKGFGFLWAYLQPLKKYMGQWILGLALAFAIQMALPFLTQSLVDRGIAHQDLGFVQLVVVAYALLWIIRWFSELLRDWFTLHLSTQIQIQMVTDFLGRLLVMPMAFFDTRTTGDFLQRIQDHQHIDDFLGDRSLLIVFDVFSILAFGTLLFLLDSAIGGMFAFGALVFLGWSLLFIRQREQLDHFLFGNQRKGQSLLVQLLTTIGDIQVNGSQARRILEWKANQHDRFQLEAKGLKLDQAQRKGGAFILEGMALGILLVSAQKVLSGGLTLGSLLAIQTIMGSLHGPTAHLVDFLSGWQRARLSLLRLAEIHGQPHEEGQVGMDITEVEGPIRGVDLGFGYGDMARPILKPLDFEISFGSTVALVGPSGSGKSTLLKLLLRLYEPDSGTLYVGEGPLRLVDPDIWRDACGAVMQDSKLFDDTLERNITESRSELATNSERLKKAIGQSQLTEVVHALPLGLKTKIGANGQLLSGGECQRVLLARALYKNPKFLFLDEATSALDAENEKRIMDHLLGDVEPRTLVFAAHRLSTVIKADKILVLDKGQIVETGNHVELVQQQGLYAQLIQHQL